MPKTVGTAPQKRLAELLVEARHKAGLTQVELAKKLKIKQQQVSHLESGQRRIDLIELVEILKAMGLEPRQTISKIVKDLGE